MLEVQAVLVRHGFMMIQALTMPAHGGVILDMLKGLGTAVFFLALFVVQLIAGLALVQTVLVLDAHGAQRIQQQDRI